MDHTNLLRRRADSRSAVEPPEALPGPDPSHLGTARGSCGAPPGATMRPSPAPGDFSGTPLRAKALVGSVDDPLEHEADRLAERLVAGGTPDHHGGGAGGTSHPSAIGAAGPSGPAVLRRCPGACGCGSEDHALLRSPETSGAGGAGTSPAPAAATAVLGQAGRPLTASDHAFFEPRLGIDLSRVRLHTGPTADAAVDAVRAKAFTVGEDIVLGSRHWSPGAAADRRLLAHELVHVAQHRRARSATAAGPTLRRQPATAEDLGRRILENERKLADQSLAPEELRRLNAERDELLDQYRSTARGGSPAAPRTAPAAAPTAAPTGAARPAAQSVEEQVIPVGVTYEVVRPLAYAQPSGPGSDQDLPPWVAPYLSGASTAAGQGVQRYVDPLPGNVAPGTSNVFTRFVGPGRGELRPRLGQAGDFAEGAEAFEQFKLRGVDYGQLSRLSAKLRAGGVSALTQEEAALLRTVTQIHATVHGATPSSPLLSLTELEPAAAVKALPPVATQRLYVVRVRIDPNDVIRVNEILKRTGRIGLAAEQEVVVALDLAAGSGARGPEILSITANQAKGAPLAGAAGTALRFVGRALVVVGAGLAVHEVVTAEGPNRRETQGRAAGSFVGATALGAFGAGLCVGLGIATGGIALALCGLGFGLAGALGGGAIGGRIGRAFD
ncbi:DUF4157 domain-containing protein [Kitasatospora sp. NPDC058170]|uniref:eCIS core domain-containing protein n=1 Tax=Kitasatospora sp. NPDC058170 TaxID=3346364 RepID=UPI0036DB6D7C